MNPKQHERGTKMSQNAELGTVLDCALPPEQKPNIVFILVNNVGWGNFGVCDK